MSPFATLRAKVQAKFVIRKLILHGICVDSECDVIFNWCLIVKFLGMLYDQVHTHTHTCAHTHTSLSQYLR